MAQWVEDPALSLLGQGLNPWPRNFCMTEKKKKKKKKKDGQEDSEVRKGEETREDNIEALISCATLSPFSYL